MKHLCNSLATLAFMAALTANAGEVLIKGRNVQQKNDVTIHHQAEDKSYGSGTFRSQGLTFMDDGQVTPYINQGSYSWDKGGSRHTGYTVRTYPDGSMATMHYTGNSRKGEAPMARQWSGTADLVSGTGRFEGAKGHGTYEGGRYANGMAVTDWELKAVLVE